MWRVLVGLNENITLSFLVVGHTKFSPDWCFGLFKQQYRHSKIGCLDDIVRVVEQSAVVNHTQLVGKQDVTVLVPTYNWASFFDKAFCQTALQGIKAMHHLTFSKSSLDSVVVQDSVTSPEKVIKLVKDANWRPQADNLPPIILPSGLSLERRQYLFDKIREFCPPHCQDLVCPDPAEYSTPPTQKRHKC